MGTTRDQKMTFGGRQNQNGWGKVESLIYTHDAKYFKRINKMLHRVPELRYNKSRRRVPKHQPPSPVVNPRSKPPPLVPQKTIRDSNRRRTIAPWNIGK